MAAITLPETFFSDTTTVDLNSLRAAGVAMLGLAVVRPMLPFEIAPPCPLRTLTGVPCPFCGMTRGVTAAVHGEVGRALFLNPASILAVVTAVVLVLAWRTKRFTIPLWVITLVLALMWSWQMFKYATGRPL